MTEPNGGPPPQDPPNPPTNLGNDSGEHVEPTGASARPDDMPPSVNFDDMVDETFQFNKPNSNWNRHFSSPNRCHADDKPVDDKSVDNIPIENTHSTPIKTVDESQKNP